MLQFSKGWLRVAAFGHGILLAMAIGGGVRIASWLSGGQLPESLPGYVSLLGTLALGTLFVLLREHSFTQAAVESDSNRA